MDLLDLLNIPSLSKPKKSSWREFFIYVPLAILFATLLILFGL
jgi:hypothetical protein